MHELGTNSPDTIPHLISNFAGNRLKAGLAVGAAVVTLAGAVIFDRGSAPPSSNPSPAIEHVNSFQPQGEIPEATIDQVFAEAGQRLKATIQRLPVGKYPYYTNQQGDWTHRVGPNGWVAGYLPGSLWLMYAQTGDAKWRQAAETWSRPITTQDVAKDDREIGLVMIPDDGNGWELTDDPGYKATLLTSAKALAERYNPRVKAIGSPVKHADGERFRMIIDNTMSLELLFWAAQNGQPADRQVAIKHAETAMKNLVRPDGSVFQDAVFDNKTGRRLKQFSQQGYSATSVWSRGQAWAMGGFTNAYAATGDPRFLETAEKVSDYFINNLPADYIPPWDFKAPNTANAARDSSAAAIAASSLLELSYIETDPAQQTKYFDAAQAILEALISPTYLANNGEALLKHATQFGKLKRSSDTGLIYADYYAEQAAMRYELLTGQANQTDAAKVEFGLVGKG